MPAVLVQDRFVSTVYWGYTIIVSHVLVTLSVFSWIGDEQNLWFVSVTRRRDARDDTHHSFCVVTLDSAGHWTQPLALVRIYSTIPTKGRAERGRRGSPLRANKRLTDIRYVVLTYLAFYYQPGQCLFSFILSTMQRRGTDVNDQLTWIN